MPNTKVKNTNPNLVAKLSNLPLAVKILLVVLLVILTSFITLNFIGQRDKRAFEAQASGWTQLGNGTKFDVGAWACKTGGGRGKVLFVKDTAYMRTTIVEINRNRQGQIAWYNFVSAMPFSGASDHVSIEAKTKANPLYNGDPERIGSAFYKDLADCPPVR